ncbi:helix-turn-helix transcriptional regulator [Streptomyces sp. PSKA30]|uniref:helix-turn-helix domain-containing protein n=1 Tax=Streptomyces sp. PSKA30 TaxID=2874597 RepID=UPI001CD078ED|nr:helix-turn-helix transcriptional regulator [Streptomyces sp. PSKA30]MBZ9644452.1 helix-turn-helix transcriptional regulator [Streptomyces sp. PSKA30]
MAFANELRALRRQAGLSYRKLADRTPYSASTLFSAASGRSLPTQDVTLAFVTGCGGDVAAWQRIWEETATVLGQPVTAGTRMPQARIPRGPSSVRALRHELCALVEQVREQVTCDGLGPSQTERRRRRKRQAGSSRHLADVITAGRGPAGYVSHVRVAGALAGRPHNLLDEVLVVAIVEACHTLCALPFTDADSKRWQGRIRSAAATRQSLPATVRDVARHNPSE